MLCVVGEHLRICPQGFTCCTQDMEHHLSTESRAEFDKLMADKISLLRNTFVSRTAKFDGKYLCVIPQFGASPMVTSMNSGHLELSHSNTVWLGSR